MAHNEWEIPRFSRAAVAILDDLHRHGWSMRIVPLFRRSALGREAFAAAVNELHERRWVKLSRRRAPRAALRDGPSGNLPEWPGTIDRITASRYGRWRYLATWPNLF